MGFMVNGNRLHPKAGAGKKNAFSELTDVKNIGRVKPQAFSDQVDILSDARRPKDAKGLFPRLMHDGHEETGKAGDMITMQVAQKNGKKFAGA
jgi:hypothetical protein